MSDQRAVLIIDDLAARLRESERRIVRSIPDDCDPAERLRLLGKAEGVLLALSYVEEEHRG